MTKTEILERVRGNLYDVGMEHWTYADLTSAIQDGYDEIALFTQCIEKVDTLTLVGDLSYYKMADYFSDYYRVVAMWNNDTNRWLEPVSITELNEWHPHWEILNGQPIFFTPIGLEYVALVRKPATTTGDLLVFYSATANTLADATTPTIPTGSHNVLEDYATSILLDQNLEYTKAQRYFDDYENKIGDIVRDLNKRSIPDRLMTLASVVGTLR